ncbi:MAG: hypothetical protein CVT49_15080 [candidate division Zixibacteria bacterium HGW-Zixibacteria-1]|nr:MAG: hypothetical protein CVT49_15080 [candidate division Zixibacteria bacterium HGW-Zixibacteria-1]
MPSVSFSGDCGDVNNSGTINILDATYLISYLYKGGPEPDCGTTFSGICGDANNSGAVNILDVTYLISYLYKSGPAPDCGTVTDIDGNVYQTIKIGDQVWMAENLKVTHYRNGDSIPNVTNNNTWAYLNTGAYCEYSNNIANVAVYGRLYNWYAVADDRNLAPADWHVASKAEWQTLIDYLGGDDVAGGKLKEAGTTHWVSPNTGATNESGFTALPGGYRNPLGSFTYLGSHALFWTSSPYNTTAALGRSMNNLDSAIYQTYFNNPLGRSVRCIKD